MSIMLKNDHIIITRLIRTRSNKDQVNITRLIKTGVKNITKPTPRLIKTALGNTNANTLPKRKHNPNHNYILKSPLKFSKKKFLFS